MQNKKYSIKQSIANVSMQELPLQKVTHKNSLLLLKCTSISENTGTQQRSLINPGIASGYFGIDYNCLGIISSCTPLNSEIILANLRNNNPDLFETN